MNQQNPLHEAQITFGQALGLFALGQNEEALGYFYQELEWL